jgi:hypothetical protein
MVASTAQAALPGIGLPAGVAAGDLHTPPIAVIRRLTPGDIVLEDYRPLPLNLEWRLSDVYWAAEGVTPFITDAVPYQANNDGRASAAAAAILFANCVDAAGDGDAIHVLEVGAGTALFARYLLDEFRALCRRHQRDFYDRLVFHVTDRSPRSVQHWGACGVFGDHAEHVRSAAHDATAAAIAFDRPWRAVFANYLLDSLPAAVLRRTGDGWQHLCARATIRANNLEALGWGHRVEWMRGAARSDRSGDLVELMPVLPHLDAEMAFLEIADRDRGGPPDEWTSAIGEADAADGVPIVHNYGALRWFDTVLPRIDRGGFVLVRDYGVGASDGTTHAIGPQRFGGASAVPVDFERLEQHLRARSLSVVRPDGEGLLLTRLVTAKPGTHAARAFSEQFDNAAPEAWELLPRARENAQRGLLRQALDIYRQAIERSPRDWRLLGEAARFAAIDLRDPRAGLELARSALAVNPWYSPFLWNVLGDCLAALERDQDAHQCYTRACDVHPGSAETHLRLARSWLRLGDAARSLEATARGLAADADDMLRHQFLESQQAAIDALSRVRTAQRETAFRRRARATAKD